jgi:hypothetical protein
MMPDSAAAHVGDNAPVGTDADKAGKLTAHEAMLKDHEARLGAVEKHLGIKSEKGVKGEETMSRATRKATMKEASRERKRH